MSKINSYSSAGSVPYKMFKNKELMKYLEEGIIPPVHVQFIPTNRCNANCSFCSCSERDKKLEMPISEIREMVPVLRALGCQSVTITGGGEPLMHPDIIEIMMLLDDYGIKIGLVTNGTLINTSGINLNRITWCRVSCSDETKLEGRVLQELTEAVTRSPNVDWAFSYVLPSNATRDTYINLWEYLKFARANNFTHVRVVSNLLDIDNSVIDEVSDTFYDEDNVIWQHRQEWSCGKKECLISLLKPVIGPDGRVFPCCGVQYAEEEPALDLPDSMSMGHWTGLSNMKNYMGLRCVKCYYDNYNVALQAMLDDIDHKEFV